jgi:hypothetical protein
MRSIAGRSEAVTLASFTLSRTSSAVKVADKQSARRSHDKFRKLGFINYNGTLEVHSSLLSVVLAD